MYKKEIEAGDVDVRPCHRSNIKDLTRKQEDGEEKQCWGKLLRKD